MLKIKDEVDLKELIRFGFITKYDENTGDLLKYIKYIKYGNSTFYFAIYVENRILEIDFSTFYGSEDISNIIMLANEKIYDLTKERLIEKVEE